MRLKDLLTEKVDLSKSKKAVNAGSPCQFLTACGINYKKDFRKDDTGADFTMDNAQATIDAYKQLRAHKKIQKDFKIEMEKSTNTIKVFFRNTD